MFIFLAILIVIACVLLIGVVLIQKSKGGGLASDYSGGNQYLGYRKTTDFVEKATWSLAIFICVVSIFASFAMRDHSFTRSAIETAAPAQTAAPAPANEATPAPVPAATPAPEAKEATPAAETKADAPAAAETKEAATPAEEAPKAETPAK